MNTDFNSYTPTISKGAILIIAVYLIWVFIIKPGFRFVKAWGPDKLHSKKWFWGHVLRYNNDYQETIYLEKSQKRFISFINQNLSQGKAIISGQNKFIVETSTTVSPNFNSSIKNMLWRAKNWDKLIFVIHYKPNIY